MISRGRKKRGSSKRSSSLSHLLRGAMLLSALCLLSLAPQQAYAQHGDSTGLEASTEARNLARAPRFFGPNTMPDIFVLVRGGGADNFVEDEVTPYLIGIAALSAIGFLFAFLTIVICCGFCCCRGCCNNCGGRDPEPEGYTKKNKLIIFGIMLVSTIIIVAFCAVGYAGNARFSRAISGDVGLLTLFTRFFTDTATFLQEQTIDGPIALVNDFVDNTLDTLNTALDETERVEATRQQLDMDLGNLASTYDNFSITGTDNVTMESFTFTCEFCTTVADQVRDIQTEISDETSGTLDSLSELRVEANGTISSLGAEVLDAVTDVQSQFGSVTETLTTTQEGLDEYLDIARDIDSQRSTAYVILFALPLVLIFLVVIGAIIKSPACFKLTCVLTFLIMVVMWLLFAVHLPIGVFLADACLLVDEKEMNFTETFGQEAGTVLLACLEGALLADVYDLSDVLPSEGDIDFGELPNLDTDFDFGELTMLFDNVSMLSEEQFFGTLDAELVNINAITEPQANETITRDNLPDLNSTAIANVALDVDPTLPEAIYCNMTTFNASLCAELSIRVNVSQATQRAEELAEPEFNEALIEFENDTNAVVATSEQFSADALSAIDNFNLIQGDLEEDLFAAVDEIVSSLNCEFVGDLYRDVKGALCDDLIGGINDMINALFFIPLFSIFVAITAIKFWKRVDAEGDGTVEPTGGFDDYDDYGQQKNDNLTPMGTSMAGSRVPTGSYGAPEVMEMQRTEMPVNNRTEVRFSVDEPQQQHAPVQTLTGVSESSSENESVSDYSSDNDDDYHEATAPPEYDNGPEKNQPADF